MHRSEKAKFEIRKFCTAISDSLLNITINTQAFPSKPIKITNQTLNRNQLYPIISSHGLNAFGIGSHLTGFLLYYTYCL